MGLLEGNMTPEQEAMLYGGATALGARQGQNGFGNAIMAALMAKAQAQRRAQQEQLMKMQMEMQGLQLGQAKQDVADQDTYRTAAQGAPNFAQPQLPNMAPTVENAQALAQAPKPSPYQQAEQMVSYLRSKNVAEKFIKPYIDQVEKLRPKAKADQQLVKLPDGSIGMVNIMDDGTTQILPYKPAEKQHAADTGNSTQLYGEYSGAPGQSFQNSVSPNTQFTGGVTMRGQNITDARARELNAITREGQQSQIVNDPNLGIQIVNKATKVAMPALSGTTGQPLPSENKAKQMSGAKNVLGLLDDAEQHLANATGSYIGAGVDVGARAAGIATQGAKQIAALKTIEGALLSQMPRMEGPQSNYDVQNYKEAAGQLGDPTVPVAIKRVAIKTIRTIQQRYVGGSSSSIDDLVKKYTQ